jgi:hypothetical protein
VTHQGLDRDQFLRWLDCLLYFRLSLLLLPEWIMRHPEGGSLNWVLDFLHLSIELSLLYSMPCGARAPLESGFALRLAWRDH